VVEQRNVFIENISLLQMPAEEVYPAMSVNPVTLPASY
jgi:hypothetical protein